MPVIGYSTDRQVVKAAQIGHVAAIGGMTDAEAAVRAAHRRIFQLPVTDGGTAGTAQTETAMQAPRVGIVKAIALTTPVAAAANASNFLTVTVAKRTAGGAAVTVGTFTTSATSTVAFVPIAFTLTNANVNIAAGDVLTVAVAKSGTGVAMGAATSQAIVTVDVEED